MHLDFAHLAWCFNRLGGFLTLHYTCPQVSYLCEGQLSDGSQGQVGVKQRHAVRHTHGAAGRRGRQQQPVDAAAWKQTRVEVHLHVSPTGQLHLAHDDCWEHTEGQKHCTTMYQRCTYERRRTTVASHGTHFHPKIRIK